jgi:hypothetical protein
VCLLGISRLFAANLPRVCCKFTTCLHHRPWLRYWSWIKNKF